MCQALWLQSPTGQGHRLSWGCVLPVLGQSVGDVMVASLAGVLGPLGSRAEPGPHGAALGLAVSSRPPRDGPLVTPGLSVAVFF